MRCRSRAAGQAVGIEHQGVRAVEQHASLQAGAVRGREACERKGRETFAAAAFADHGDALAGLNGQRDIAHGRGQRPVAPERDGKLVDLEQGMRHHEKQYNGLLHMAESQM
jgi:hypothetical protein